MAVIKKWEAVDVLVNPHIILWIDNYNVLHVSRNYQYVDSIGNVISSRLTETHEEEKPWSEVPQEIRDALTKINTYINSAIDKKEGIVR